MNATLTLWQKIERFLVGCISDETVIRLAGSDGIEFETAIPLVDEIKTRRTKVCVSAGIFTFQSEYFELTFWAHIIIDATGEYAKAEIVQHGIGTVTHINGSTWKIIITKPILEKLLYWLER